MDDTQPVMMTWKQFYEWWLKAYMTYRQTLQTNEASDWSQDGREWGVSTGIVQGGDSTVFNGMWRDLLNREQVITMLYRYDQQRG